MGRHINRCIKHAHKPVYDGYLPERLLDVRGERPFLVLRNAIESSKINPGLLEASSLSPRRWRALLGGTRSIDDPVPEYCALSYCWGSPEQAHTQLTTTSETLSNRLAGISEDEIPPVLRDAITITKALGVPYLWIDSLCILQRDTEDWDRQCAQMDKIYGSALVTLFAGSSSSCQEGFLQPRGARGRVHIPFKSTLRTDINGSFSLRFQKVLPQLNADFESTDSSYDDVWLCRLRSRGWGFQEEHMSTRRIFFGHTNTHFSCGSFQEDLEEITDRDVVYERWDDIMNFYDYTKNNFTLAKDALPALTGIASVFGNILGDEYLAGHWHGNLFKSLLWYIPSSESGRADQTEHFRLLELRNLYAVPSWSRVLKGHTENIVRFGIRLSEFRPEAELTDFILPPAGTNRFGRILNRRLIITGKTITLQQANSLEIGRIPPNIFNDVSTLDHWVVEFNKSHQILVNLDFRSAEERGRAAIRESTLVLFGSSGLRKRNRDLHEVESDEDTDSSETGRGCENQHLDDEGLRYPFGLVLRPSFMNPEVFHRIGVFSPTHRLGDAHGVSAMNLHYFSGVSEQQCINLE